MYFLYTLIYKPLKHWIGWSSGVVRTTWSLNFSRHWRWWWTFGNTPSSATLFLHSCFLKHHFSGPDIDIALQRLDFLQLKLYNLLQKPFFLFSLPCFVSCLQRESSRLTIPPSRTCTYFTWLLVYHFQISQRNASLVYKLKEKPLPAVVRGSDGQMGKQEEEGNACQISMGKWTMREPGWMKHTAPKE